MSIESKSIIPAVFQSCSFKKNQKKNKIANYPTHPPRSRVAAEAPASSLSLRLVALSRAQGLLMPTDTKLGGAASDDFGAGFSLTIKPAVVVVASG